MALYTILFGLSIFMIALVMAVIKKMFFCWKEEHQIETRNVHAATDRPACSVMIFVGKCFLKQRKFEGNVSVYDIISKEDTS